LILTYQNGENSIKNRVITEGRSGFPAIYHQKCKLKVTSKQIKISIMRAPFPKKAEKQQTTLLLNDVFQTLNSR